MAEQTCSESVDPAGLGLDDRAWEISSYRMGDKAGILALIRDEYGEVDLADGAYYDWLREASPPDVGQWVVREKMTGRVISAASMVGVRAIWKGQEIKMLLGFNMVVAPEYRRQGIHTTLIRQTREEVRAAGFCLSTIFPNPRSMPQLERSKTYYHVSQVPLLIRPLNMRELAGARASNALVTEAATLGWALAGRSLWREQVPPQLASPLRISEDLTLGTGYDCFWNRVRTKYDLMLVRDRAFLRWRFLEIPTREYHILSARKGDEILGYIVLRLTEVRGIMTGLIADFLVLAGEEGNRAGQHLLHAALERFKEANMPLAGGLVLPHTQEYALMRRAGFLSAPKLFAPQPFHLFVRSHCDDPPLEALTRPETWYVSIADHDAV